MRKGSSEATSIVAMYEEGLEVTDIQRITGKPRSTLDTLLRREGVKRRPRIGRSQVPRQRVRQIVFMYEQLDLSARQIGKIIGRSQPAVWKLLRREGVRMKSHGEGRWVLEKRWRGSPLPVLNERGIDGGRVRKPEGPHGRQGHGLRGRHE